MRRNITSADVAKEAGVSRATVSYALNNTQGSRIADKTKLHVLEVAKRLGYHQDVNAQALKTQRSMSIGIVSRRDITETRFINVLSGIKDVLDREKYSILLCSDKVDEMGYPEYYRLFNSRKIDGIIFISQQEQINMEETEKCAETMIAEGIPSVFSDYHINNPEVNCIEIDYFQGAYIATRYMIEKGYLKIAFLRPDNDTEQERQRLEGIKQAISQTAGAELFVYSAGMMGGNSFDNIVKLLKNRDKHRALITAWESLAAETLYFACKMKIEVPDEIAVIALGENLSFEYTYPRLSICKLPTYELGAKSACVLLDSIKGTCVPEHTKLPCELNIRESS